MEWVTAALDEVLICPFCRAPLNPPDPDRDSDNDYWWCVECVDFVTPKRKRLWFARQKILVGTQELRRRIAELERSSRRLEWLCKRSGLTVEDIDRQMWERGET
jgi:hypothetical protein